jgi:hypothetical protein
MNKKQEPKYYKAECGCILQEDGRLWKWVYDCKGGWNRTPSITRKYPFTSSKMLVTKGEVAILKLLGKEENE